ncbi:MAG: hypothetical protein LAN37_15960 [Acidobacteriia bacterium]|nr:hypothetical protein [Terriglobia bacterium]
MTAKAKGELAESIFAARAEALGLQISKPLGENQAFDFHVQSRLGTFRVQVKSAWKVARHHYLVCLTPSTLNKSSGYDVLVVYIAPLDAWYVIPAAAVEKRWLMLYPHIAKSNARYERYLEGWRTLTGDVRDDTRRVGLEIHAGREG